MWRKLQIKDLNFVPFMSTEKAATSKTKSLIEKWHDDFFTYYSFPNVNFPNVGWKIHVSATYQNYRAILKIVKSFCVKNQKNFKVIRTKKQFFESISKIASRTFSGKFITIYPSDVEDCKFILEGLLPSLKPFNGPEILTDRRYKDSVLQYRYGILHKDDPSTFKDILRPGFYKPENIADPFQSNKKVQDDMKIASKYSIRSAITFSNFGGTYRAEDEGGNKYVLKEARPFLGFPSDNPMLNRQREVIICKQLNHKWFPTFIETVKFHDHLYTIFEYSEGISLNNLGESLSLIFSHNLVQERKEQIEFLWEKLITEIVKLLIFTKDNGLILNDVKSENFLWDGDKNLKFIDLDFSFFQNDMQIPIIDTFGRIRRKTSWWNDVRNVGYMLMDLISCSRFLQNKYTFHNRIISYFEYFCNTNGIKESLVSKVLFLANFNSRTDINRIFHLDSRRIKHSYTLETQHHVHFNFSSQTDLFKILRKRMGDIHHTQKSYWFEAVELIENNLEQEARSLIEKIISKKVIVVFGEKIVITEENTLSCYLRFGTSLLIYLLLLFREKFRDTFFDETLSELLLTIAKGNYLKIKFWEGALGVILSLIKASEILKNKLYLTYAQKHFAKFKWNYIQKYENYVEYDSTFLEQWEKGIVDSLNTHFYNGKLYE